MSRASFAAMDTVSVYFPLAKSALTSEARERLDDAIYKGVLSDETPLSIIGYTDELGGDDYNLTLSRQRALAVKAYLVQSGFREAQITLLTGKGEREARPAQGPEGRLDDRRVDIVPAGMAKRPKQTLAEAKPQWRPVATAPPGMRKPSITDLSTLSEGQTIVLDKIYFIAGRHVWRDNSKPTLETLYDALAQYPNVRIRIEGHVCCVSPGVPDAIDDDTHRMELSLTRARAIRDYLVERGIASERLQCAGFGHSHPVVMPELTEDIADRNRRVEVRIIK